MIILTQKLTDISSRLPKGQVAVFLKDSPLLPENIAFHTDLRVFCHKSTLICAPSVGESIFPFVPKGADLICGDVEPAGDYPCDVPYNAVAVGRFLIANIKTVSPDILAYAKKAGLSVISVKQGYCRCNVTVVSDKEGNESIITEDDGISAAARMHGIDVLTLSPGGVRLTGWDNGFIGGSSMTTPDDILFFGDLDLHPQGKKIEDFCRIYGKNPISAIQGSQLFDYGGGCCI